MAQDAGIRGAGAVGSFLEGVVAPLTDRPVHAASRQAGSRETVAFCQTPSPALSSCTTSPHRPPDRLTNPHQSTADAQEDPR